MTEKRYKAGIIGLGFIGAADQVSGDLLGQQVSNLDGTHLAAFANHPQVDIVCGSSRDEGRRERFAQRTQARTYGDWREMLANEALDIVSIATYTPVHADMTVACAKHGIPAVFCEKPLATRLADAELMAAACREANALLAINHNRRFHANYRRLRDFIAAGNLGDLTSASLQWGSGRLGNVGTHTIDALCMLTGRKVQAVSATLDLAGKPDCRGPEFRDPGGWGVMRMDGGLMVTVDAADYGAVPIAITINGSKGRAITGRDDVTIEYWDGRNGYWPDPRSGRSSMDQAVIEIVTWLDEQSAFPYAAEDAVHTMEAIVAFHASHARHAAWVELPLKGADREHEVNSG